MKKNLNKYLSVAKRVKVFKPRYSFIQYYKIDINLISMGLFSRKEKEENKREAVPSLPDLPKLPSIPNFGEPSGELSPLPNFPKTVLGEKFSQDVIKKAVNGKKEEGREISEDDFSTEKEQMIQESPQKSQYETREKFRRREIPEELDEGIGRKSPIYEPSRRIINREIPEGFEEAGRKLKDSEPIFVRIDKFEESRKIFEKTKEQIFDIERALNRIKTIKQEEDRELASWEQEIMNIKDKIGQVEKDIFSKA